MTEPVRTASDSCSEMYTQNNPDDAAAGDCSEVHAQSTSDDTVAGDSSEVHAPGKLDDTVAGDSSEVHAQSKPNDTAAGAWSRLSKFDRIAITILLFLSLCKGLTWCLLVPPFYGFDEPMHFMYGRKIQQTHNLRFGMSTMVPLDILELDTPPEQRTMLKPGVSASEVYIEDKEQGVATQPGFYTYHPPLYYCVIACILSAMSHQYVLWQIFACRLLSVGLGAVTAICAYMTGKFFWRDKNSIAPLTVAALVALQPMSAFSFGMVTNSALEITLFSMLLVTLLRTSEEKMDTRSVIVASILMCVGLLNKLSFACAAPLVILAAVWQFAHRRRFDTNIKTIFAQLSLILLPGVVAVSLWFSKAWQTGGDSLVRVWDEKGRRSPFTVIDYLCHFQWFDRYAKTTASYFGHFGWKDASLPIFMIVLLTLLFVAAGLYANIRAGREFWLKDEFKSRARNFSIVLLSSATVIFVVFYQMLDMRVNALLGGWFTVRGQYYLSALIGPILCVVLLLNWKRRNLLSDCAMIGAIAATVWLNFFSLFGVVTHFLYGTSKVSEALQRAAELQPVGVPFIAASLNSFGIACGLLLLAAIANMFINRGASEAR